MGKETVFLSLKDAQLGLGPPTGTQALFGTKPVIFVSPETSRPVRKMEEVVARLIQAQVLPNDAKIHKPFLIHGNGDPAFVGISRGELNPWLISCRVMDYNGSQVATNSSFNPAAIAQKRTTLTIVSGVCLFGATAAEGIGVDGTTFQLTDPLSIGMVNQKIARIKIDPKIHPYEADAVLRITGFVRNMFGERSLKAYFHIPRIEYYLYGLELFSKGVIDRKQLTQLFEAVDRRAAGIENLIRKRQAATHTMETVAPLTDAEDYIRTASEPDINGIVDLLSSNPLWGALLRREQPRSFLDINFASYIYAYLARGNGQLMVAVENPEEQKILTLTQRHFDLLVPTAMVGIYVHPNVLVKEGNKRFLYYQPNRKENTVRGLVEIAKATSNR